MPGKSHILYILKTHGDVDGVHNAHTRKFGGILILKNCSYPPSLFSLISVAEFRPLLHIIYDIAALRIAIVCDYFIGIKTRIKWVLLRWNSSIGGYGLFESQQVWLDQIL